MAPLLGTSRLCRAAPALPSSRFYCGIFISGKNPPLPRFPQLHAQGCAVASCGASARKKRAWGPGMRPHPRVLGGFLKSGASPPCCPNFLKLSVPVPGEALQALSFRASCCEQQGRSCFGVPRAPRWLLRQPRTEFNPKFLPRRCFPIKPTK